MAIKVIFLTSGSSWTVPSDWNSANNTIEMIDGGGSGYEAGGGWTGGNGGDYRKYNNVSLTPGATATYTIGGGSGGASSHQNCNTPAQTIGGGFGSNSGNFGQGIGGNAGGYAQGLSWTSTHTPTGSASVAAASPGAGGGAGQNGFQYGGGGGANFDPESGGSGGYPGADGIIVVTYTTQNVQSGAGSAAGIGAAASVGRAVKAAAGVASGSGTAAAVSGPVQPTGRADGVASVSGVGASTASAVGVASGVGTASGWNIKTVSGVGSATGLATVHAGYYQPSRIILGRLPSDAYGLRVSNPGYNASTHPVDDQKLIFSSEWPDVMPIHARGSFVHRSGTNPGNTATQEVDIPIPLGYVPFCDFVVRGNGDALPAGSDSYPTDRYYPYGAISLPYWDGSGNVVNGDTNAYLRLNVTATKICARSFVRSVNGQTLGLPRTWTIYYTLYRKQAS